jgi:hypothetical protein
MAITRQWRGEVAGDFGAVPVITEHLLHSADE